MTGDDCSDKHNSQNRAATTQKARHKERKKEKQLLENKGHANMQPYKRQCKETVYACALNRTMWRCATYSLPLSDGSKYPKSSHTNFSHVTDKHTLGMYGLMQIRTFRAYHTKHTQARSWMKIGNDTFIFPKTSVHRQTQMVVFVHTQLRGDTKTHIFKCLCPTGKRSTCLNSAKLEMKEKVPLPTGCSYKLR